MVPARAVPMTSPAPAYIDLEVTSNFSFLRGASHPAELVLAAAALGRKAIAISTAPNCRTGCPNMRREEKSCQLS